MPAPGDMNGKAALVTGAANGLGRAAALKLAQAGADVCLVDREPEGLESAAAEIRALGRRALVHPADLSQAASCPAAVAAAVEAFGRLDALCNVAAVYMPRHTTEMTPAEFQTTLAVNLAAPFYLIQAAIPHLLASGDGAIVNVTSCAAHAAQAYMAAYCATKAGLSQMTKALAMEFMHQPLRVNAVAPGGMMTKLTATAEWPKDMDRQLFGRGAPLRGLIEVEDAAEMVAYLASPAGRSFHGACINIDKGITAG